MNDARLPEGTTVLHIGPHKTGTTALQGALRQARDDMAEHGVVYAGSRRQHWLAALAVTGARGLKGDAPPPIRHWDELVEDVAAASDQRVIVSSEVFCEADEETARKVVAELGGPRVHVLVTLRPLGKIMPSAWQQYVRNGLTTSFDGWLDGMLNKPPYTKPTTTFWKRHRHDALVERWASIVGPQNLTVVVLDESDRSMLMRTFEQLVGLPSGLLIPEGGRTNRSLTLGETELVRRLNIEFKRRAWPDKAYRTYVRIGMTQHLQEAHHPTPDEAQITTPRWALERAAQIGAEAGENIAALGVHVIGDLSSLGALADMADTPPDAARTDAEMIDLMVPLAVATEAVVGTIAASVSAPPPRQARPVTAVPTRRLIRIVVRRALRRARRLPGEHHVPAVRVAGRLRGARRAPKPIKVSVVVPVYNPGVYIEPCIASLLKQTMPADELELIFVDDGSTDETPRRLEALAAEHPHVKVIRQENSGWSGKPRNVGTDAATGAYVQYLDQDDELREEALERLYAFARRNESDIVIGKMVGIGRRAPVEVFRRNQDLVTIHDSLIMTSLTPHKMFRRAFLVEAGLRFAEGRRRLEDHLFVVTAYFAARRISVLSDYVCYVHNSRTDRGNAASLPSEPRDYFANLCEALDVVDANTDPGPARDRVYRRWLHTEMVGRLRGRRLLKKDDAYRRKLFDAIRGVVLQRFSPGVDAGLRPVERLVSALVRRGDFESILSLAHWEQGLKVVAHVTDAGWRDGALEFAIQATLVDAEGTVLSLDSTASGPAIRPPLPEAVLAELSPQVLNVDGRTVKLDVVARHAPSGSEVLIPSRNEGAPGPELSATVRARLDPDDPRKPLADAAWNVAVRFRAFGWTFIAPVTRSADGARIPPRPQAVGTAARKVKPVWRKSGQLGVKVGSANNRARDRTSPAPRSHLHRSLDRLSPPLARRLRRLTRRFRVEQRERQGRAARGRQSPTQERPRVKEPGPGTFR